MKNEKCQSSIPIWLKTQKNEIFSQSQASTFQPASWSFAFNCVLS